MYVTSSFLTFGEITTRIVSFFVLTTIMQSYDYPYDIYIYVNITQFNVDIFIIDIFLFILESEDKEYVNLKF